MGEMRSDAVVNKGGLVRTLSVSDPSLKRKRLMVNVSLLDLFFLNGVLLYVGMFVTPSLMHIFLAMVPVMTVVVLFQYILLKSVLLRGAFPVNVYSNGIEFPEFLFNRLIGRPTFLRKEEIEEAWTYGFSEGPRGDEMKGHLTLHFRTRAGKLNDTGARGRLEIEPTIGWIERNWGLRVERRSIGAFTPPRTSAPGMAPLDAPQKICPQCGKGSDLDLDFCPFCGAVFDRSFAPAEDVSMSAQWQAPADPRYDPFQRGSSYPYHDRTAARPSRYPPVRYVPAPCPDGKNPRTAFMLGLVMGFLGLMGMGHLYLGKTAKGLVLLFVGGFLATLSFFAWMSVWDMTEYELGVRMFTAMIMSAPYLVLQVWQAFDAPKF
jgi:TM2 domain-containing membrane protein YozV